MLTISIVRMFLKYIYIAIYNIIIFFKKIFLERKDSKKKLKNSIELLHGTRYKTGTNYIIKNKIIKIVDCSEQISLLGTLV